MKKIIPFFILIVTLISCGPQKAPELTPEERKKEEEAVMRVIKEYNAAYQTKNYSQLTETLSEDVIFFGSDSAETIKSLTQFKKKIEEDTQNTTYKYGEPVDVHIIMDNGATVASVIYGMSTTLTFSEGNLKDKQASFFLRVARTLKKSKGRWYIASGIISITQTSQASSEIMDLYEKFQADAQKAKK